MVSFKSATSPVSPVEITDDLEKYLKEAMKLYKNKRFSKASTKFLQLSRSFSKKSKQSTASHYAMMANSLLMRAMCNGDRSIKTKSLLEKAIKCLERSLKTEPYWDDYLKSKSKLETYIHQTFGCEARFNGKTWETHCYKVSIALGLPGVSPSLTQQFECSICGKDPICCDHVLGEKYDGRIALAVAKNIRFDHVAIVDEPMQLETYVLPRPLTANDLKRILPPNLAKKVIAHRCPLTCQDLLKAIRTNSLRGINWKSTND